MDPEQLAEENAHLRELLKQFRNALLWCSGSSDFGPGGKAHQGWTDICAPLLKPPDATPARGAPATK